MTLSDQARIWVRVAEQVIEAVQSRVVNQHQPSATAAGLRPRSYLPFLPNPNFQPRPGEFKQLEALLFGSKTSARLGLAGVVDLGNVGKTYLAVELAARYKDHFPDGIFWITATGTLTDWQKQLADLAERVGYLPPGDTPGQPDTDLRRARHFAAYLAEHKDALLVLDNVEHPELVTQALHAALYLARAHQPE